MTAACVSLSGQDLEVREQVLSSAAEHKLADEGMGGALLQDVQGVQEALRICLTNRIQ